MSNTYLTRTPSSSGNRKTFTFSFWFKRSKLSSNQNIYNQYNSSNGYNSAILFNSSDDFIIWDYTNAYQLNLITDRKFRDVNAWYHAVIAVDTTQATASNRAKIYINGVQETSFSTATYPSQNLDLRINEYQPQHLGVFRYGSTNADFFDGSMSHFHFIDGTAYDASAFGETDATTGEWKIKTSPSVTYGTNGYWILKDGNTITDSSPNSNNFSLGGGTLTKTEDSPSNVFATYNPLIPNTGNLTFSNGNTTMTDSVGSGSWTQTYGVSTLGMTSGKYYAETKVINIGTDQVYPLGLIKDIESTAITTSVGSQSNPGIAYYSDGRIISNGNDVQTGLHNLSGNGDIIGLAFDATNGTAQWYRNGATLGTQVTGLSTTGTWYFVSNGYQDNVLSANFGNGYFGTTAVSSAGTNASGNGIFEYDVPANFTALSTKGLNL